MDIDHGYDEPPLPGGTLWTEEPVGRRRMPDPVRASAVRAVLIVSVTLIEAMVAMLGAAAGAWITAPALLCTVVSTVVATWAVLDVWVTRQVWIQRHGVVSSPSDAARPRRPRRGSPARRGSAEVRAAARRGVAGLR
ncbi:hypothetical protein ACFOSC_31495 [Streptantibioticus rubrisoli]|uniref:Uncharacterized protein n=1 Tax=Streptantibioticus rubrisoli TaxID=1387313 RepID=A0ABT1P9C2_9ACTN|nr:hypothetical protein [Streptantibioticus rubrisoli]MCQ4041959.1 hypothetical protein [Streptantibioticus rubrisoli]